MSEEPNDLAQLAAELTKPGRELARYLDSAAANVRGEKATVGDYHALNTQLWDLQDRIEAANVSELRPLLRFCIELAGIAAYYEHVLRPREWRPDDADAEAWLAWLEEVGNPADADHLNGVGAHQDQGKLLTGVEGKATPVPDPKSDSSLDPGADLESALAELERLVGLASVKAQVRTLVNMVKVQEWRKHRGLPAASRSNHLVFVGAPGTGKTTVARLIGRIFRALGILERGQLIETDRSGLVAGYLGQTGLKTNKIVDEALDGVLFIDEAYSLSSDAGQDSFGREAIEVLLKRMEDARHRLIVIVAGYTEPMQKFLDSNPGLRSRFSEVIEFSDYSPAELLAILQRFCDRDGYELTSEAKTVAERDLTGAYLARNQDFGNARLVRNYYEDAIANQANRLASATPTPAAEDLSSLTADDLPGVPQ